MVTLIKRGETTASPILELYRLSTNTNLTKYNFVLRNCNICSSPVTLQVKNSTATTLNNVNITVDKEQ